MTGDKPESWLPLRSDPTTYKHQNYGNQIRVEVEGSETRVIFVSSDAKKANALAEDLLNQIRKGSIKINIAGRISSITEEEG